jgi:hypothetical protein
VTPWRGRTRRPGRCPIPRLPKLACSCLPTLSSLRDEAGFSLGGSESARCIMSTYYHEHILPYHEHILSSATESPTSTVTRSSFATSLLLYHFSSPLPLLFSLTTSLLLYRSSSPPPLLFSSTGSLLLQRSSSPPPALEILCPLAQN